MTFKLAPSCDESTPVINLYSADLLLPIVVFPILSFRYNDGQPLLDVVINAKNAQWTIVNGLCAYPVRIKGSFFRSRTLPSLGLRFKAVNSVGFGAEMVD